MKQVNSRVLVYLIVLFFFLHLPSIHVAGYNQDPSSSILTVCLDFNRSVVQAFYNQTELYQPHIDPDIFMIHNQYDIKVPVKPVRLLLPYETTVDDIQIETSSGQQFLLPEQIASNHISLKTFETTLLPSSVKYNRIDLENESMLYDNLGIQFTRGYPILHLNIYPVQYQHNSDNAVFFENITIRVITKEAGVNPLLRNTNEDKKEVIKQVHNPDIMYSYEQYQPANQVSTQYDYVIITTQELQHANGAYTFDDLISLRESQGLSCTYKTVESIYNEYDGIDEKEKIRNFIKDAYLHWDTSWVLLGGDVEHVPIRYLWDFDGQDTVVSSDLYYQCLDGNYNFNQDGRWGEKYDGVDGERIDLHAEIYIGRAPVDDENDVSSFVEKTLIYENSEWETDQYLRNHLSVGEYTWDGPGGWGAGYVERCIDYCTDYNHATHGISSQTFDIITLYERDETWSKQDIMQRINEGASIINHVGHGSYSAAMKLFNVDVSNLDNEGYYGLLYSQACHSGQVEKQDCFAEQWVNEEKKGGFAAIMNSGVGYGGSTNYDGADNRFAREFFDALFSNAEQISTIGKANQDSKEDNFWRIEEQGMHMYHVYYDTNLFGDPYVKMKGSEGTIADFRWTPTYAKTNEIIQFTDESIGEIISWEWRFGDGHTSSQQNPTHKYYNSGEYTVKLTIMDNNGYRISASKEIQVKDFWLPFVNITYTYHGSNEFTLAFSGDESFDPDGTIVNWTWDFDDGTKAYTPSVVHTFPEYDEYRVDLTLQDNDGNTNTEIITVEIVPIFPPENLVVSGTSGGISETMYYFTVQSHDPQQLSVKYCWDWGDNTSLEWTEYTGSGIQCRMGHQWMEPGTYTIRVKAKNNAGIESQWSDEFSITIVQNNPPIVDMLTPSNGVYIQGQKIFPFIRPLIFGNITLQFSVVDGNGIEQVQLFIDGNKVHTFTEEPYSYGWPKKDVLFPLRHKITIKAYDRSGKMTEESFRVLRF